MTEDFREERAKEWDAFGLRWLRMAWIFYAIGIGLAIFTIRYTDDWVVNWLAVALMLGAGFYFHRIRIKALQQAQLLRSGRRT